MKKIEKNEEMFMTEKLADQLMQDLMCVAISATGGAIQDSNGKFNQKQIDFAQKYAKKEFCYILEDWEEIFGKKWNIGK